MDFIMLTSNESFSELHDEDSLAQERTTAASFAQVQEFSQETGPSGNMGGKILNPKFMKAFTNKESGISAENKAQTLIANRSLFGSSTPVQPQPINKHGSLEAIENSEDDSEQGQPLHKSSKYDSRRQDGREWNADFGDDKNKPGSCIGQPGVFADQDQTFAKEEPSIQIIRSVTPIFSMRSMQTPSPTSQTEKNS